MLKSKIYYHDWAFWRLSELNLWDFCIGRCVLFFGLKCVISGLITDVSTRVSLIVSNDLQVKFCNASMALLLLHTSGVARKEGWCTCPEQSAEVCRRDSVSCKWWVRLYAVYPNFDYIHKDEHICFRSLPLFINENPIEWKNTFFQNFRLCLKHLFQTWAVQSIICYVLLRPLYSERVCLQLQINYVRDESSCLLDFNIHFVYTDPDRFCFDWVKLWPWNGFVYWTYYW